MDTGTGRVQALVLANTRTNVIYERFYAKFSDLERASIREAFQQAGEGLALGVAEEAESCSRYRCTRQVPDTAGS